VKPELVAEIEFSRWTRYRILRHSSYRGLRPDKPAGEVELELAAAAVPASSETRLRGDSPGSGPRRDPPRQVPPETDRGAPQRPYEVLHETRRHAEIEVQGRRLRLSNREKVLYPQTGLTKGQLVDYYAAVAPVLLGHLAGRPVTLKRYPDGVDGQHFYDKRCPAHRPEWVQTAAIWSGRRRGGSTTPDRGPPR
jgi:bifunctional non-homologous end joining protein LigD